MLDDFLLSFAYDRQSFLLLGVGFGTLLLFFGLAAAFAPKDRVADRMKKASFAYIGGKQRRNLIKSPDQIPAGLLKALIPEDRTERTQIRLQLEKAGFTGGQAVKGFYLFRLCLALIVPCLAIMLISIRAFVGVPPQIDEILNGISNLHALQILAISVAIGFYGPTIWLRGKINARQLEISEAFPNALDLMQISAEAGLGFDAAMTRVGQQIERVSPTVSQEFLLVQTEILAGRDREQALLDMADRMGIDEARSFVNVVLQAIRYGSSISEALLVYAVEMRDNRELAAQEKANKLPVQMSAVMASLMLPALFMITLGPTVIRYIRIF
ncbi:MAG: type II secretion system F family protein [Rhodobacter sp.]|nr:type II secretion system F family protein [Rhodobacter sp.]